MKIIGSKTRFNVVDEQNDKLAAIQKNVIKNEKAIHLGASVYSTDIDRVEHTMTMLGTNNKSEALRFIIEAAWSVYGNEIEKRSNRIKSAGNLRLRDYSHH